MNKSKKIRFMTGVGILSALTVVLALIGTYAPKMIVSVNFALIPIILGACIYGPLAGLFLGLVDGVMNIIDPSTIVSFWAFNPIATALLCLLKTGLAGLAAGYLYKLIRKKNTLAASTVAAFIVPIINTTIFILGVLMFFVPLYDEWAGGSGKGIGLLITGTLTINLLIEVIVSGLLSPAIHYIIKVSTKNFDIGDIYEDEEDSDSKTNNEIEEKNEIEK